MGFKVKGATFGFLLVELLVALSLIGTLTVLMSGIYMQVLTMQKSAYNLVKAVELATYTINQYSVNASGVSYKSDIFTMELDIFKEDSHKLSWLRCTVTWKEHEKVKKVQITKGLAS